jgi:uncharacterized membrane protein HdeD (DUF308 family)
VLTSKEVSAMDDMQSEPGGPPRDQPPGDDSVLDESAPYEPPPDDRPYASSGGDAMATAPLDVDRSQAHQAARRASWAAYNWPWVLGLGVVAIIFGLVVLSHAFGSLSALLWLTGLFLLFMGVAQLVTMGRGGARGAHFAGAVICILGGLVLLVWPGETLKVVAVVAGITFLLWGLMRIVTSLREERDDRTWDVLAGGALTVLGIVMMVWPSATITLVGVFVGLVAIAWGVLTVIGAFDLRRVGRGWKELHDKPRPRERDGGI